MQGVAAKNWNVSVGLIVFIGYCSESIIVTYTVNVILVHLIYLFKNKAFSLLVMVLRYSVIVIAIVAAE